MASNPADHIDLRVMRIPSLPDLPDQVEHALLSLGCKVIGDVVDYVRKSEEVSGIAASPQNVSRFGQDDDWHKAYVSQKSLAEEK